MDLVGTKPTDIGEICQWRLRLGHGMMFRPPFYPAAADLSMIKMTVNPPLCGLKAVIIFFLLLLGPRKLFVFYDL